MRHIESFNENDEDLIQFGLKVDELKWYFTDLIDDGFSIRAVPMKKLFDFGRFDNLSIYRGSDQKLGLVHYIMLVFTSDSIEKTKDYINSDHFNNILDEANNRLSDIGLYIESVKNTKLLSRIQIFIYRKSDEKYIK
jgi:hypothetical protein